MSSLEQIIIRESERDHFFLYGITGMPDYYFIISQINYSMKEKGEEMKTIFKLELVSSNRSVKLRRRKLFSGKFSDMKNY